MKNLLRTALILALCLMMAIPASAAAPVLVRDNLDTYTSVAYGTSLLREQGKNGYSLNRIDGTALTDEQFTNFAYEKGIITAVQYDVDAINCKGAFDENGNIVIPFEYGVIEVKSPEWALAFVLKQVGVNEDYDYTSWESDDVAYTIVRADIYRLPEGTKMVELSRENYHDASVVNHRLNVQDRSTGVITTYDADFNALGTVDSMYADDYAPADYSYYRENGQYGIMDAEGNVVYPPSFTSVYIASSKYAVVSTDSGEGLVDMTTGELVLPAEFDSVKRMAYLPNRPEGGYDYEAYGYCAIVENDKAGYATRGGEISCEPKYSRDVVNINGISAELTDLEGNLHIIAADGVETVIEGYDNVRVMDYTSGVFYRVTNDEGKYGLIDWHGEVVLPCEYTSINITGDGRYALVNIDYEKGQIYELIYPGQGETTAPAEESAGDENKTSLADKAKDKLKEKDEESAPENEQPAGDNSAAIGLINSAVTLLNTDADANSAAAVSLLQNAAAMLSDANPAGLLNSAATLLNTDAAANAAAVESLLNNALAMLQ